MPPPLEEGAGLKARTPDGAEPGDRVPRTGDHEGLAGEDATLVGRAWRAQVSRALGALGLPVRLTERVYPGGVSLALAAPIDALYTATAINDWAFDAACAVLAGGPEVPFEEDRARPPAAGFRKSAKPVGWQAG